MEEVGGGEGRAGEEREGGVGTEEEEGGEDGEEEELHTGAEDTTPEEKHHQSLNTRPGKERKHSPVWVPPPPPPAAAGGGYVISIRPRPLASLSFGRVSIVMLEKYIKSP